MNDDDLPSSAGSAIEEPPDGIDRRSFLSRSALASGALLAAASGGLAAATSGCGATSFRPTLSARESDALLARLERGLARIREVPRGRIARELPGRLPPDVTENVVKLTMEALVVADVKRALPERAIVSGPLAARMAEELPLVEDCARTHHALLTRMPRATRRRVNQHIRRRPDVPTEIAAWIDERAAETGVERASRLRLRRAAAEMKIRMRRQSATAVIDDTAAKVGRVLARSGASVSLARRATTAAMIDGIWQQIDGVPPTGGAGGPGPASRLGRPEGAPPPRVVEGEPLPPPERRWNAQWGSPGDPEVRTGAIMMPLGLLTCGILLFVGLGILIAGVVQNETWDGTPEAEVRARRQRERERQRRARGE